MNSGLTRALALVMCAWAPAASAATANLQIYAVEGDGAVSRAGSRSIRPITVLVTDEAGRPVEGAAVSFQLEDESPGTFRTGLRTEVLVSGTDGRVSVWGMEWGSRPGTAYIRVTAAKGEARAGTVITQSISDRAAEDRLEPAPRRSRWKLVGILAAGAAGAVLAAAVTGSNRGAEAGTVAAASAVQLGTPVISIGKP